MATMREISDRLKKYANGKSVENAVLEFVNNNKYVYLDIQRDQIFNQRVDRDGGPFGHYKGDRRLSHYRRRGLNTNLLTPKDEANRRALRSASPIKGRHGAGISSKEQGQPFNLLDTGDFSNKMTLWVRAGTIVVTSRSRHMQGMLKNQHIKSKKWFGLTPENEKVFTRRISRYAAKWITAGIAGKPVS